MGLFDKVKNLFTEEVEEPVVKKEEPKRHEVKREIKKQERQVEIAPARRESSVLLEEHKEEEVPVIKHEEKTILPIYFSDEDFEDLEKPKRREIRDFRTEAYQGRKEEIKKVEKKTFKPSPIISPVYGILNKNYKKDDITTKPVSSNYDSSKVTVDDIRNKAYGTLEDELENSLIINSITKNEKNEESAIDIFEELETRESRNNKLDLLRNDYEINNEKEEADLSLELERQKQKIEEINEIIKKNVDSEKKSITSRKIDNILEELDEIEELIPDSGKDEIEVSTDDIENVESNVDENLNKIEENEDTKDDMEESDLFNLIDSMYERRDDE